MNTSEITLEHPAGRVRVKVPTDVRVHELMPDFLDVTSHVEDLVRSSQIDDGICLVFSPHTTAAITVRRSLSPSV